MLGLLQYKAMTGYDIKRVFDKSINSFWAANLSQIYRELDKLEKNECLTSVIQEQSDRPNRRIYSITDKGKLEFKKWITSIPKQSTKEVRDEFTLRIFFGANLSREELIKQFQLFIKEKQSNLKKLQDFNEIRKSMSEEIGQLDVDEMCWKFVIKKAIMSLEMLINWGNECIDELSR